MDIVLFGIQGSGKGTLGRAIAQKYNYEYFETGAQLRKLAQEDSELGHKVKQIIESGQLVSNEVVMDIVENFVNQISADTPIVFDGIPRKPEQAKTFEELLSKYSRDFTGILVDISEETAIKRITTRRICSKCKAVYPADYTEENCEKCGGELITRSDDNPESIKTRFKAYNEETTPVIEDYKNRSKIIEMDGTPPIPQAREAIFKILEEQILNKS